MKYKLSLLLISMLFLQACVGIKNVPMTSEKHKSIKTVEIYNLVIQDELRPYYDVSQITTATGGGLLFAMIDASVNKGRSKTAFELLTPLYDATEELDFRKLIAPEFNAAVKSKYRLVKAQKVAESVMIAREDLVAKVKALKKGQVLLYLSSSYELLNQAKTIQISTQASAYLGGTEHEIVNKEPKPDYRNLFVYNSISIGAGDVGSLDLLKADNGALLERTMKEGISEITDMLLYDVTPDLNESCHETVTATGFYLFAKPKSTGLLLKHLDGRALIRDKSSQYLLSLPTSALGSNDRTKAARPCPPVAG